MRCLALFLLSLLLVGCSGARGEPVSPVLPIRVVEPPELTLSLEPESLRPGDYSVLLIRNPREDLLVEVDLPEASGPIVFRHGDHAVAIVAVDYRVSPGKYTIRVCSGTIREQVSFEVLSRTFPVEHIRVGPSLASVRDPSLFEEDGINTARARSCSEDRPLWEGFTVPLEGPITSGFGLIRYINGSPSGRHSGLDIAAPTGTPVVASSSGVVKMARRLHVSGLTVILDHGLNVFSAYSHLDRLLCSEGEVVKKGRVIGEVGSTGFSTGPHLHWSISVGSTFVDPLLVVEQGFPVPWPLGE